MGSGGDAPCHLAALVIERHLQILRANLRALAGRSRTDAREQIADAAGAKRRPAQQTGAENADRDGDRQLAAETDKGCDYR